MPSFLNAMTRQIPSSSIHAATQKAEAYRREGKKVVIFSIGRPDFDTPAHIKEAAKAALDKGYVHYTPNMGILPLREAVAEHIKRQTGVSYDPKTEVMITCGGQQAILLTMKAVLEPGDEVLLPSPGYGLYYNCAAIADAQVRAYALKAPDFGWGGAEAGERTKMLFINSPHNPTGAVLSKEELGQIADFAKANNLLVVSDEAYDRLLYDGLEHRSIASEPGMRDRTVILGSFSKTYSMTGWRIGYLAGPAEVIRGMALLQQSFVLSVNSFAQWGAVEAMTGPQDCVEEMRQQFDIRRRAMMEALSTIPNVSFAAPKGAFPFHSQIFSAANPSMALGNAYEMLSDFYKAHPEVLKKEIKGVKLMFIHAYPVGDCVMTKSAPILKLDDIKGKKLGFEGGGLRFETMQALGASVVGMNMSDLYQAMQGGIIDGIVMDFDPLISRRYGEEVKHVTLLNITGTAFYVVMNQERYDSLPDDLKAIVDDMSQNYGPNLLEKFWAENVYGSLDKWIKEMGGTVHVLSDEDYARADKLAAVPAQAWFKSLDKAGYRGAELEKTFHQLEAKYFTPWRQSEAYRYVKQQ